MLVWGEGGEVLLISPSHLFRYKDVERIIRGAEEGERLHIAILFTLLLVNNICYYEGEGGSPLISQSDLFRHKEK